MKISFEFNELKVKHNPPAVKIGLKSLSTLRLFQKASCITELLFGLIISMVSYIEKLREVGLRLYLRQSCENASKISLLKYENIKKNRNIYRLYLWPFLEPNEFKISLHPKCHYFV